MTLLLTILSVIGLIAISWGIAKYAKNDNLFWILLTSMLAGMAGGAIVNKLDGKSDDEKKVSLEQVYNPTQVSPAGCIDFYAEPGDALAPTAKPAGKVITTPTQTKTDSAPSRTSEEIRGQPCNFNPFHLGNPGLPFDTS